MGDRQQAEFDCREALHRIYHFLDGELTLVRRREIEAHLDGCSPCLKMFGFEAELRRVVHDRCRDAVPDGLRRRIADSLNHEHGTTDGSVDQLAPSGAGGGAAEERTDG